MSSWKAFVTKHFGGIPTSVKDLEWIYRARPDIPPIIVSAKEYREVAPGSQPPFDRPENDAISKNYYYTRDTRRAFPATAVYTSEEIKQFVIGEAQRPQIAASSTPAETIEAAKPFVPPIIDNRYKWQPSMPHLAPNEVNPQFSIRGFK